MSPLELLIQLKARDSTGQLRVVTGQGRQIRIGIDAGRIVQIEYGPWRGRAALELAAIETAISASFQSGAETSWDGDLPSDRALLGQLWRMLGGIHIQRPVLVASAANWADFDSPEEISTSSPPAFLAADAAPGSANGWPAVPRAPSGFAASAHSHSTLTATQIAAVKDLLLEFVGPMAQYLVDECLIMGARNVSALVDAVAQEIDSYRDARAFMAAAGRMGDRS